MVSVVTPVIAFIHAPHVREVRDEKVYIGLRDKISTQAQLHIGRSISHGHSMDNDKIVDKLFSIYLIAAKLFNISPVIC